MTVKFQLGLTIYTYLHAHNSNVQCTKHVMKVIVCDSRYIERERVRGWGGEEKPAGNVYSMVYTVIESPSLSPSFASLWA